MRKYGIYSLGVRSPCVNPAKKGKKLWLLNQSRSEKMLWLMLQRACILRNFFKTQNPGLVNNSGLKPRVGYNGACTAGVYQRSIFKIRPNIIIGLQKLKIRPKDRSQSQSLIYLIFLR